VKANVAFVASTMPAKVVAAKIKQQEIQILVVENERLIPSYRPLVENQHNVVLVALPRGFGRQVLAIAPILLKLKLSGSEVFFFHECCFVAFDLLVWLLRPRGVFSPQVNMLSFNKASKSASRSFFKEKGCGPLLTSLLERIFTIYDQTDDGGAGTLTVPVIKRYPDSISYSEKFRFAEQAQKAYDQRPMLQSDTILFLAGTDSMDSHQLRGIYTDLMKVAQDAGYDVHIKDHPNEEMRLHVEFDNSTYLDPSCPAELLNDSYRFVIGTASAAMACFGERSISIVNLLSSMNPAVRDTRRDYLKSISSDTLYIDTIAQLSKLLLTAKNSRLERQ